jgi:tetratricopeptide (TPR) repeat protein
MKRQLTAVALALCLSNRAFAGEPTEAEKRTMAEAIFEQASTAMAAQDYATACPRPEEVVALQPNGIGARIKLGECYEASGRLASAHASYAQAASMATIAGQNDRAAAAQASAGALEPRLSRLTIRVSAELAQLPGLSVMRGSAPITPALFNTAIAVDGGRHTVVAAADGRRPFTASIDIDASGAAQEIVIALPLSERSPVAPEAGAPSAGVASDSEPPAMPPVRIGGIVVGAVGLALAGVGIGVAVVGRLGNLNRGLGRRQG